MAALSIKDKVAVIGAGTMGAGIAQVAATAGHQVLLIDIAEDTAKKGKASIQSGLEALIERGKKTQQEVDDVVCRIRASNDLSDVKGCKLVVEAIVEDLKIKQDLFAEIESICEDDTIIASNTSSISISALSAKVTRPGQVVGMHFFNPAVILKLVEIVSGLQTDEQVAETIFQTSLAWGKKPVHTKSTPGFIVNRVARPFYAEALRSLNEQVASVATIDSLMRSSGNFKMGPLELTDLIGQDVNCAVTESVYNAFFQDTRFTPSVLQTEMVTAGLLGRKSGRGFYDYSVEKPAAKIEKIKAKPTQLRVKITGDLGPARELLSLIENASLELNSAAEGIPKIEVGEAVIQLSDGRTATQRAAEQSTPNLVLFDYAADYLSADLLAIAVARQASEQAKTDAIEFFQALGKQVCVLKDVPGMQVLRTIAMLVNEAYDALNQGVCDADAIDTAMQSGVAYPKGPIAWGQQIGLAFLVTVLTHLQKAYGESRYRVSPLLLAEQHVHVL